MASDFFLQIEGIKGESADHRCKDQCEILSFGWGCSQPAVATASSSGAISGERAELGDLKVVKLLDKASPQLMLACASGKHLPHAVLTLHRAQGDKTEYMRYVLEDVLISSYSVSGSGSAAEPVPMEEFSLNYTKISFVYTKSDKTGLKVGRHVGGWSRAENKAYLSERCR